MKRWRFPCLWRDQLPAPHRDAGFTLLEMLVALVVFGLVMDGIAQTFRFGLIAWSAGPAKTAEPESLAALDAALTRMIAQIPPGAMTGHPDGVSFITRLPAGAGLHGGLADAAIMDAHGNLILRYGLHPPGVSLVPPPPPTIEVLAQGVSGFTVAYLAPQAAGPAMWSHSWKGTGLPLLVRLHIDFVNHRNWPDLVAPTVDPGG